MFARKQLLQLFELKGPDAEAVDKEHVAALHARSSVVQPAMQACSSSQRLHIAQGRPRAGTDERQVTAADLEPQR